MKQVLLALSDFEVQLARMFREILDIKDLTQEKSALQFMNSAVVFSPLPHHVQSNNMHSLKQNEAISY